MKLHIKNFRSIKQLDLELAPITVLYGHNGTGKSSALYAPLTMRNIVVNPNQEVSGFFNYGFTSLGSFKDVVFNQNPNNELELGISLIPELDGSVVLDYSISCSGNKSGYFKFKVQGLHDTTDKMKMNVSFPYRKRNQIHIIDNTTQTLFVWNGINAGSPAPFSNFSPEELNALMNQKVIDNLTNEMVNAPRAELRKVSFVPLGRGFYQPVYSLRNEYSEAVVTQTEQEVTDLLATERHLEYAVSQRMEQILNRNFHVRADIGSGSNLFSLDAIDRQTGLGAGLVNDGFGVNQLVYMLAKVLHPDAGIVCIEEPEIHLHPTAIRRLVHALAEIVGESGNKHLLISTHSEQFIMSLLALVAGGSYAPDDLAIYLVSKEGKASEFQRQQVSENGQIEDGLASFLEGELEDMKVFLGV